MNQIIYPLSRLLANPRIFHAIANAMEGPDAETIKDAFYNLLEYELDEAEDLDECVFSAENVCFQSDDNGDRFEIAFDSGIASVLNAIEGELKAQITNDSELAASTAIYQRLVSAIEECSPDLEGDVVLCSPPTPGNSYLRSTDGNRFVGKFHLLSDPDKMFSFHIEVIDVRNDQLKAHIQPL